MKLYEILSKEQGASVDIRGYKVSFKRMTLQELARLQKTRETLTEENAADVSMRLVFDQLTEDSQELFGSFDNFMAVVDAKMFSALQTAFKQTQEDSEPPIEKK